MQKKRGGEGVQIACKIAHVLNGRPLSNLTVIQSICGNLLWAFIPSGILNALIIKWLHMESRIERGKNTLHIKTICSSSKDLQCQKQYMYIKGTHNQSQSLQTQMIKNLFSVQICITFALGTTKV